MPAILKKSEASSLIDLVQSINVHVSGRTQHTRFQRMYANDRVAFAYDVFPALRSTITPYQIEILSYFDEGKNRVAVRGPHGLGKTLTAALLVHHSVLTAEADCKVPTTASAWRQLEKYLWPEIKKLSGFIAWPVVGRPPYDQRTEMLTTQIRLKNGIVEAFALASDQHQLIEGAHATFLMYVFDEAKAIPVPTWDAAEGAFSTADIADTYKCLAFAISTPGDPSGRFFDIHNGRAGLENWIVRHVTLDEAIAAKRISPVWAEQMRVLWGEESATYQNRVLGEFADEGEDGVIPRSWVRLAQERWQDWDMRGRPDPGSPSVMGIDVAREGRDRTVLACRTASVVQTMYEFSKLPTTSTVGHIKNYNRGHILNIEMDGGLGAAVYDMLREDGIPLLRPITVGGRTHFRDKSGELTFSNVRAAMWYNLREHLDPERGTGVALPMHEGLVRDLTAPRFGITRRDGAMTLESKRSIKSRLGRSTDYGDAVCLSFWNSSTGGGVVF